MHRIAESASEQEILGTFRISRQLLVGEISK